MKKVLTFTLYRDKMVKCNFRSEKLNTVTDGGVLP